MSVPVASVSTPSPRTAQHLRIVQVIHALAPHSGGPTVTVPALCLALGHLGHEVRLHITSHGGVAAADRDSYTLTVHGNLPFGGRLGVSPSMHRAIVRESVGADVLHSHGIWLWTNLDADLVSRLARVPHVLSPRGMLEPYALRRKGLIKKLVWGLGQGAAVRRAACLHVTAESELASVRALGLKNPVALVPNGVLLPPPVQREANSRRRLLFLGRIDHVKGVDNLLEAWRVVAPEFPDWSLDLVGPDQGRFADQMKTQAADQQLRRLTFHGALYGETRNELLRAAELMVLPSRSENFGMAVAEGLAYGLPVICARGAPWSGLDRNQSGWWIDIGVDPLVAALRRALALSPQQLREMGARGRQWMADEFSWEAQARKLTETYGWLQGRAERPAHVDLG